jgi:DDE superfamily endonuclease
MRVAWVGAGSRVPDQGRRAGWSAAAWGAPAAGPGSRRAELADAVLCRPERVHMLAELSLEPECRRGHGAVYDAVNCGGVQVARRRRALAALPLPAWDDGRIRLAVDVSNWLRPDAEASPHRLFCHCYARGKGNAQMIPGWPYSFVAALEPGPISWTLPLDAVRLGPADDATEVTAAAVAEPGRQAAAVPGRVRRTGPRRGRPARSSLRRRRWPAPRARGPLGRRPG